jgi:hypothetical protein
MPAANGHRSRRSSRLPISVPVRVTSLEPNGKFSEICETLVVNAHGCAMRFPIRLSPGIGLRLYSREGREAIAYVVACVPVGPDGQGWTLGARLEQPDNFWGLETAPEDWRVIEMPSPASQQSIQKAQPSPIFVHKPQARSASSQVILDKIEEQLSEDRLRGILVKLVKPLQSEMHELREKLTQNARRNRFEVSLNNIPPEVQEKLWERLHKDLGTRVLQQAREQSAEVFGSVKNSVEQKVAEALGEFRHRLAGELHTVEQRARTLAQELTTTTGQQLRTGVEKIQRQALDAGANLESKGAEVLVALQSRLGESHDSHSREVEQIHARAGERAMQLQLEITDLTQRLGTLNESVRKLESELDVHLERLAGELVSDARTQIEATVMGALKDLQARGSNEVEIRVDEVCGNLRTIQNRIENSFSGSLQAQSGEAADAFGHQIEIMAQHSIEKWRSALSKHLKSAAKVVGQEFQREQGGDS